MTTLHTLAAGTLERVCPVLWHSFTSADDFLMPKVGIAAALALLLVLVRRSRPKQRVIFNY